MDVLTEGKLFGRLADGRLGPFDIETATAFDKVRGVILIFVDAIPPVILDVKAIILRETLVLEEGRGLRMVELSSDGG